MKILAVIPARGGSKGIPGKNIKKLGDRPLIAYSIEAVKQSRLISKAILSSDSEDIITIAQKHGLKAPFKRPDALAQDNSKSIEVIIHALKYFKDNGQRFDAVCIIQPTTPFRDQGLFDRAIRKFIEADYDSLVSVRKVPQEYNPHWCFEEEEGLLKISTGEEEIISRRQDLPIAYHRDGAFYITKTDVILDQNSLYGKRIGYVENSNADYVNLDTMEDWYLAENILNSRS